MKNHNESSKPQQNLVGQGDSVETKEITDKPQEQSKTQEKLDEELVQNYLNHFGQTEEHLPPSTLIEKAKFWEKKQEILGKIKTFKKTTLQSPEFRNLHNQIEQNEELKEAFIKQMEEEFATFTTPPSTLTEGQLIQIQLYGKLVFSETISLDAKLGNQTLMILEALNNANDFTPERFTETISALLKNKITHAREVREAIKANLLQKAKNAITEEHKKQRLQYNEQHQANNIVAIQIYTYLNTDVPASSVDGIVGKNTREAQNILKGQKATTENGKQLYANHHKLKEEVHNHQQRSKEYLKSTPTSTKSMNETSIFDIRGNTTLTTFLQKQGETDIPTSETFQQRHNEATRTVILQSLTELLGEGKVSIIKPFLDEKGEINNLESLKTTLTTLVNEEEIGQIMRTIQHPNHQLIDTQVRQKFWETSKGKMENLKAIGNILQYVKGYLNQTTVEQQNFGENFNWNPNSKENLNITNEKIIITGMLQGSPPTPISFSYDMKSGILSMNNIAKEQNNAFTLNNTEANVSLLSLGGFDELKNLSNGNSNDILDTSKQEKTADFQKEYIELNIEKNRTTQRLITTFGFDKKHEHTEKESSGSYHMFQLLQQSLTTPDECRLLRTNLQRITKLIGKHTDQTQNADGSTTTNSTPSELTPDEKGKTTNQYFSSPSTILPYFFGTQKREQDQKNMLNGTTTNNGLYNFLKVFTTGINKETSTTTQQNEHQKIDIHQMKDYLSAVENGKEQEYLGNKEKISITEKISQYKNGEILAQEANIKQNDEKRIEYIEQLYFT